MQPEILTYILDYIYTKNASLWRQNGLSTTNAPFKTKSNQNQV